MGSDLFGKLKKFFFDFEKQKNYTIIQSTKEN